MKSLKFFRNQNFSDTFRKATNHLEKDGKCHGGLRSQFL